MSLAVEYDICTYCLSFPWGICLKGLQYCIIGGPVCQIHYCCTPLSIYGTKVAESVPCNLEVTLQFSGPSVHVGDKRPLFY